MAILRPGVIGPPAGRPITMPTRNPIAGTPAITPNLNRPMPLPTRTGRRFLRGGNRL